MGIGRFVGMTAILMVGAVSAGCLYVGWDEIAAFVEREPRLEGVRKPLFPKGEKAGARTNPVALTPGSVAAPVQVATAGGPAALAALETTSGGSLPPSPNPPVPERAPPESQMSAIVPPAWAVPGSSEPAGVQLERPLGERGIVILQIGDSHTSADFLTGELRRRLQERYGRGAPGYVTAGRPHVGVRSSTLKVTSSSGWTYKSLQKIGAVASEFWLSGYNATATAPGETMSFASDRPVNFEMIEIEVLRQPGGGKIDIKLDGHVETSYDLASSKPEPVVIRLLPTRGATEKVKDISITTTGRGPVTVASVAIYNKQSGLTFNSIGYPGAQASLINKFDTKLLANDLVRIDPQIVILSFGTNEASNDRLDLTNYRHSYERIIDKIKTTLPGARIVVVGPPDFAELPAACRKGKSANCGRTAVASVGADGGSAGECAWRTPAKLHQIREVQRDIAQRHGLVYWNWASIMPQECGAHRWYLASPQLMAKDHVHFTIEGYKKSADQFLTTLIPVIEKVRVGADVISNN
jgi:lysophospholipase L1-like esterase